MKLTGEKMYNDSFKIRYEKVPIAVSVNATGGNTRPHIHREVEMIHVKAGSVSAKIGGESFRADEGDMIFVNPMESHALQPDKTAPYRHSCICFDTVLIPDDEIRAAFSRGRTALPHILRVKDVQTAKIGMWFEATFLATEEKGDALFLESTAYISLIFATLLRGGLLTERRPKEKNTVFCEKVLDYLATNYAGPVSSADAAEKFFYTQSHFCRSFRENFGTSFSTYLNMYRIAEAKKLLESGRVTIADAAFACGFDNPAYFTKCFKKQVGICPSEYQKNQYST